MVAFLGGNLVTGENLLINVELVIMAGLVTCVKGNVGLLAIVKFF